MMHSSISFLKQFLDVMVTKNIVIASLRYKPFTEEMAFNGDYDFVTAEKNIDDILNTFFGLATSNCINFVIDRTKYGKLVIQIHDKDENKSIVLEIWSHLDVKSENSLRYIFWEDLEAHIAYCEGKGFILSLDVEALYYLSHLKSKAKDLSAELIQERLSYYKNTLTAHNHEYADLFTTLLADPSKRDPIAEVANSLLIEKKILYTAEHKDKAAQEKKIRLKISLHRIYGQLLKKIRIFPVVGPDGSGKSSLIAAFKEKSKLRIKCYRFKNLFRQSLLYKATAPFLKRKLSGKIAVNKYDDVYGAWMVTIAAIRFPFLLLLSFFTGRYYFSDRFFHDFILQDTRFMEKTPRLRDNWQDLLHKTPDIFWFIHLDAPTAVILARKDELSAEAIDCYRTEIFKMYLEKPSLLYSYINTANPIERCADILLETAKRTGIQHK
jgi:hypothetical protein